jgi:O-antigen ligase
MKHKLPQPRARRDWHWIALFPLAAGTAWAASVLAVRPLLLLAVAGCCLYVLFAVASFREPLIFVVVFLVILITLPPLYFPSLGETPVYVSPLVVPIGLAVLVARMPDFHFRLDAVAKGLGLFLACTGLSLPFACWLSGRAIGGQSLLRWLMLDQTALIYILVRSTASARERRTERWLVPILLVAAVASAGYGIFDFYWPVPLAHPAADQFIWLQTAVVRRAQGVFYEASSFANLCGLFLVVASAAFLARQENAVRIDRPWLLFFIAVLSLAEFVSFSRSSWGNALVSLLVFAGISGQVKFKRGLGFFVALLTPLAVFWFYSAELWNYLVSARLGSLIRILADPNLASSGRAETWTRVVSILREHPQYLLFGVGYKTLPFTRLFHEEIITDNGFLNLLLETGVVGLAGFLAFSVAVFKTLLSLTRRSSGAHAFWSAVLFSFWCGEWVQMMAADAYTYWRSMVVLLALMAFTLNRAERGVEGWGGTGEGSAERRSL